MVEIRGVEIQNVESGSIAEEMGVVPGDKLVSVDGEPVIDVLDYRFRVHTEDLCVRIEKLNGEIWELEIEKESYEDLGIEFSPPLMAEQLSCRNKCVFCFVDQQPPGLRPSLYFKDDDPRLSFLFGNYVTLTNIDLDEVRRLAGCRLSPLRISVHTADMALRKKMMGNEKAGELFEALNIFKDAGIEMHFQVVLCKGLNDGAQLDYTIDRLFELSFADVFGTDVFGTDVFGSGAFCNSLAVVPAGLTRHRDGLFPLENFAMRDAQEVIRQVEVWQKKSKEKTGSSFVFLADEWYIIAGEDFPQYAHYENFPQLDNGVGSCRLFERSFFGAVRKASKKIGKKSAKENESSPIKPKIKAGIITGTAASGFIGSLTKRFQKSNPNIEITVYAVKNVFFGESVTVSGLLTGGDIINSLKEKHMPDILFIPENAFRHGENIMLDGTTLNDLSAALNTPVRISSSNGAEFYKQLSTLNQSKRS